MQFSQAANSLFKELDVQMDIKEILAQMEGELIDAARGLEAGRETALQNRVEAYRHISKKAHWAANELHSTKSDLVEIVNSAEEKIQTLRDNAEKAKAVAAETPLVAAAAIAAIEAQLEAAIVAIVADAKAEAHTRDMEGAGTVAALSTDISQWAAPFANHILPQSGGMSGLPGVGVPAAPPNASSTDARHCQPSTTREWPDNPSGGRYRECQQKSTSGPKADADRSVQQTAFKQPDKVDPTAVGKETPRTSSPPSTSSPSSGGGSSSSNPASVIGQMMKPASSGSSSSGGSSSGAVANPAAAQSSQLANANGANAAGGANGAGGAANAAGGAGSAAGRAPNLAGLGSGLAESSARMASGAVNTAANVASAATNAGTNVAQNLGQAGPQASAAASAATDDTSVRGWFGWWGAPPMSMMPTAAAAVGLGPVSSVTAAPPVDGHADIADSSRGRGHRQRGPGGCGIGGSIVGAGGDAGVVDPGDRGRRGQR